MGEPNVKFIVKDFRAVANADIALDGISVLTGENGCGKSSISELLYDFLDFICNYNKYFDSDVKSFLSRLNEILENIYNEFIETVDSNLINKQNKFNTKKNLNDLQRELEKNDNLKINKRLNGIFNESLLADLIREENNLSILFNESPTKVLKNGTNLEIIQIAIEIFNNIRNKHEKIKKIRPFRFSGLQFNETAELIEFDVPIVDRNKKKILPLYSYNKSFYYDTPFAIEITNADMDRRRNWWDLIVAISSKNKNTSLSRPFPFFKDVNKYITNGTFNSDSINEDEFYGPDYNHSYLRSDGQTFNLLDCATGLRSFAVLQLLTEKGHLNNKTLLILDEPEAHLHPQWIVEYARLVVLLHKELGVKFLISSHNPDMISAIKYIAEKEKVDEKLNFYLAEKAEQEFKYNFVNLHTNIEPIFASFNIALDRIDEYGGVE